MLNTDKQIEDDIADWALLLEEEESERTFTNLLLWSENESPYVRLQVSTLKIYYEQVYVKKLKRLP